MTGRISRRYVDPGNLVLADNTVLTIIVTEDPIYAYFDVDEPPPILISWPRAPLACNHLAIPRSRCRAASFPC